MSRGFTTGGAKYPDLRASVWSDDIRACEDENYGLPLELPNADTRGNSISLGWTDLHSKESDTGGEIDGIIDDTGGGHEDERGDLDFDSGDSGENTERPSSHASVASTPPTTDEDENLFKCEFEKDSDLFCKLETQWLEAEGEEEKTIPVRARTTGGSEILWPAWDFYLLVRGL